MRYPAGALASITRVRLSVGSGNVALMNISTTGMLVRCPSRLVPGTPITVSLDGGFQPSSVKGRVARCLVADLCGPSGLSYHVGIAFNDPIPIEEDVPETSEAPAKPVLPPESSQILVNRW